MAKSSSPPAAFDNFGDFLKYLRRQARLSQRDLSIAVGYSESQISRLETNHRAPDLASLAALFAPALGIDNQPETLARLLAIAAEARAQAGTEGSAESEAGLAGSPGEPPFKGLQFFDEPDAAWFFGRESVARRLAERLCSEHFLAVIGASGGGKSSVIRAGLVPLLRQNSRLPGRAAPPCPETHWQILVVTPTAHPLEVLATSLARDAGEVAMAAQLNDALRADPRGLHRHVHERLQRDRRGAQAPAQERVLVVVDQFEELFTLCRDGSEREAFAVNLLTAAGAGGGGTTVVLALRADFYGHLAGYPGLSAAVAQHQEYLEAMNAEELRQAIEGPAAHGGWQFAPGLVDLMLHDVGADVAEPGAGRAAEPGALPLLSHALLETWKHRRGRVMDLHAYTASGGVRGAIAHTAEGVFQHHLTPAQQTIARDIFLRLTELGEGTQDTRRRVSYQELMQQAQAADVEEVLARLADARLITTTEGIVEVAHEALIREWPTLRQWLDEDREGLRLHRHLTQAAQAWVGRSRDPDELYRGTRLGQALEWWGAHPGQLNALEQEFLQASRASGDREAAERGAAQQRELEAARQLANEQQKRAETQARSARQLRSRAVYLRGALVVALVAGLAAVVFGQRAGTSALRANQSLSTAQAAQATSQANFTAGEAERLGAEAVNLARSGGSSELVSLLALRSMNLGYSPQGDAALQAAAAMPYPYRIFSPGHGFVAALSYSPDGRELAVNNFDRLLVQTTVSTWDIQSGQRLYAITGAGYAQSVFSPDSRSILIAWGDANDPASSGIAEVRDVASGRQMHQFIVGSIAAEPHWIDNQSVVFGYAGGSIRTFDVRSGKELGAWNVGVWPSAISAHNTYVIGYRPGAEEVLVRVDTGAFVGTLGDTTHLSAIAFSADEAYAAVGFFEGVVDIMQTETGQIAASLPERIYGGVTSLDFSPDSQYLLTANSDKAVRLWRLADGALVETWPANSTSVFAQFSPDGRYIATGSDDAVRLWAVPTLPERPILAGHQGILSAVAFSPDGSQLATAGLDQDIRLWDVHTGQTLHTFPGSGAVNYALRFSPDGKQLLVATDIGVVILWDIATEAQVWANGPSAVVYYDAAFSPDGQKIIVSGHWQDGSTISAVLLDTRSGYGVWWVYGGTFGDWARLGVDFSPDGRTIVLGSTGYKAYLWETQGAAKPIRNFSGHTGFVSNARFSPDGRYLATASLDKTARLWDVATGQEIRQFIGHTEGVSRVAFSPDGHRLATASHDGTVRIWDVATGQELRRFVADAVGAENVAWSPDGTLLASVGADGTAKLWDADYHSTIAYLCGRLQRDLTDAERAQYTITDPAPTCGQ
jgi:WD40 repeat protein/transcriptional regulator with XRE-family HTH domain